MKRPMILLAGLLTTMPLAAEADDATRAQEATAAFGGALKSELMNAMKDGGPVAAIEVCNTQAPVIAQAVSLDKDLAISRVSLKNRNPSNAPNEWQREVLALFEQRKAAGEDPSGLTWQATVETESGAEFRFMKAIPTGGLCLQCHGQELAPEVAQKLQELYPEDQATGYSPGDLRGAFVVTKPASSS